MKPFTGQFPYRSAEEREREQRADDERYYSTERGRRDFASQQRLQGRKEAMGEAKIEQREKGMTLEVERKAKQILAEIRLEFGSNIPEAEAEAWVEKISAAILTEREQCANLPQPPARIPSPGYVTDEVKAGYAQAWLDYADAIRSKEDMTDA